MTGYKKFVTDRMKVQSVECYVRNVSKQLEGGVRMSFSTTLIRDTPTLNQKFTMTKDEAYKLALMLLEASR